MQTNLKSPKKRNSHMDMRGGARMSRPKQSTNTNEAREKLFEEEFPVEPKKFFTLFLVLGLKLMFFIFGFL